MNIYGLQWDTTGSLPFQPDLQAFYINGKYATRPIVYRPGAVWVDVIGDAPSFARWFDVESETATPAMARDWLLQHQNATQGVDTGGIYCSPGNLDGVLANVPDLKFDLWLATLNGNMFPHEASFLPSNVRLVAVQAFPAAYTNLNADLSVVVDGDYWNANRAH